MTILTKQAVLFYANGEKFRAPNGYIGKCPDWVTKTRQFKEMVADGVIVATESTSDKAVANADKKSNKRGNRGNKNTPNEEKSEKEQEPDTGETEKVEPETETSDTESEDKSGE